ncbi:MAG: hypothetical protein BMS9Abin09_0244 [Gammaproteobacteria bacterium]|nr:MAG: hypothetical protein BMS9Abin09_0244 [Gammaproteobacteria bacterium]
MRFCMVTTFYPPYHYGGDATYVRALSRALVARGHEVEVVHCEDAFRMGSSGEPVPESVPEEGITVHRLKSRFGFLSALITQQTGRPGLKSGSLRKILDRGFDIVNFHNVSLVGGPAVLTLSKAPVTLYTLHEHWLLCPTHIFWKNRSYACDRPECFSCSLRSGIPPQLWRYTGLVKRVAACVDAFISPSEYTARKHQAAGLGRPIHVVPLFSVLDPGTGPEYTPPQRPRFLFVGRVTASKGIVPLLEYFARSPDFDLWVIGDGDLREQLLAQYGASRNIRFIGKVQQSELAELYRVASALIFSSLAPETFGLSVVEAFACGTPAIVRKGSGGSRELIESTGAGFIYRNEEELDKAVRQLAENMPLRIELGNKARAAYEQNYTPARHVDTYLEHIACIQKCKGITVH